MTVAVQVEQGCDFLHNREDAQRFNSSSTAAIRHSELPEYDYPTPVFVRNTFLDTPVVRPFSLDEFVKERRIQSCPLETCGSSGSEDFEEAPLHSSSLQRAVTLSATLITDVANDAAFKASLAVSSFRDWWNPVESFALPADSSTVPEHHHAVYEPPADFEDQGTSQVICLAGALGEPVLGSSELPTVGSAGHRLGTCRPCAFLHKRGCGNGVQCSFCHLCDAGEKKRRQKEKIAWLKVARGFA
mmetsp:Transcript_4090/g.6323  ORF Transcript_4090/g.6323 Transcript_4090/m.6323 type:complete len:244 (+) Transcript_4090:73-804(+)